MITVRDGAGVVAIGTVVYVLVGSPLPLLSVSDTNEATDLAALRP